LTENVVIPKNRRSVITSININSVLSICEDKDPHDMMVGVVDFMVVVLQICNSILRVFMLYQNKALT